MGIYSLLYSQESCAHKTIPSGRKVHLFLAASFYEHESFSRSSPAHTPHIPLQNSRQVPKPISGKRNGTAMIDLAVGFAPEAGDQLIHSSVLVHGGEMRQKRRQIIVP